MKITVERVLIIANLQKDDARRFLIDIVSYLEGKGIVPVVHAFTGKPTIPPDEAFDAVVSLGGDGTVLYAARVAAPKNAPIFPVNLGRLGFIAEIAAADWVQKLDAWLEGALAVSERLMLSISVERDGGKIARGICLNDGVVSGSGIAKIISLAVSMSGTDFLRYRADGIIIATPTGSTAYSLAAGGPILAPGLDAMIITPICPFTISNRPIVVPAREHVCVRVDSQQRTDVMLTIDGQTTVDVKGGDIIRFEAAPFRAKIVGADRNSFYDVIKTKLNLSGGADA